MLKDRNTTHPCIKTIEEVLIIITYRIFFCIGYKLNCVNTSLFSIKGYDNENNKSHEIYEEILTKITTNLLLQFR